MRDTGRRIMAVVLTHNAPDSLARCLGAIASQTLPPGSVLVLVRASLASAYMLTTSPGSTLKSSNAMVLVPVAVFPPDGMATTFSAAPFTE